jgi:ABC-2 type transport system ATP-binding protein
MAASTPAYVVEHLTKYYRHHAAPANDDISLTIRRGEIFGIFGPNGAGKTTLVRQLTALLKPSSGTIRLFGHDVVRQPAIVPHLVGYYGQKVVALQYHTVREVLVITGILRGLSTAEAKRQAAELIERFALEPLAQQRLSTVSGGEQRLAVLLATLIGHPPVLIFDEPTNELDPVRRRTFWAYLGTLSREQGVTVVLTTHNLSEAEHVVERVAVIDQGHLVALATPGELKRQVADQVRLEVRLRPGYLDDAEAQLQTLQGSRRVRPGWWEITAPQAQATALLPAVIETVGWEALDDFRLITPTLEDVYVHVTGKHWHEGEPGEQ